MPLLVKHQSQPEFLFRFKLMSTLVDDKIPVGGAWLFARTICCCGRRVVPLSAAIHAKRGRAAFAPQTKTTTSTKSNQQSLQACRSPIIRPLVLLLSSTSMAVVGMRCFQNSLRTGFTGDTHLSNIRRRRRSSSSTGSFRHKVRTCCIKQRVSKVAAFHFAISLSYPISLA
jgi:hypothetical protein